MKQKNKIKIRFLLAVILFTSFSCLNNRKSLIEGKWKSLQTKEKAFGIDFEVIFRRDYTFTNRVRGGGQEGIYSGFYTINKDTIKIIDKSDKPVILCNYSDTGIYTFHKKNDTLLFRVIKDLCERRKLTLEIGLLKKE